MQTTIFRGHIILAVFLLVLTGCRGTAAVSSPAGTVDESAMSSEEKAFVHEAEDIAEQMFALRTEGEMSRDDGDDLKAMYMEYGYNQAGAPAIGMYYDPTHMKEAQAYLDGVSDYILHWAHVYERPKAVEVQLKYTVTGNSGKTTQEWLRLRERPDNDDWMKDNHNHFVITSHQIKL